MLVLTCFVSAGTPSPIISPLRLDDSNESQFGGGHTTYGRHGSSCYEIKYGVNFGFTGTSPAPLPRLGDHPCSALGLLAVT